MRLRLTETGTTSRIVELGEEAEYGSRLVSEK
jgi:hypothetical protein